MSHHDTILYKKVGRAPAQPICSCDPNDPQIDALFAATKQNHIDHAIRSGSQMPVFSVSPGDAEKTSGKTEPVKDAKPTQDAGKDAKPKG